MSLNDRIYKFVAGLRDEKNISNKERTLIDAFIDENIEYIRNEASSDVEIVATLASNYLEKFESNVDSGVDSNVDSGVGSGVYNDKKIGGKNEIVSFMGMNTLDKFATMINPDVKRKKAYMCLDSRYATFNSACTRLTWSFVNNVNTVNNSTNVVGPVKNITWIRMHSMVVRKFDSIPRRATILVEELSAQAFIMPSGRRFHFVGLLNDMQYPVPLPQRNTSAIPSAVDFQIVDKYELLAGYKFNDGFYRFNKPITELDNVTISIGNPDTLVVIPKYEFLGVTVTSITATELTLEFPEPHNYTWNVPDTESVYTSKSAFSIFIDDLVIDDPAWNDVQTFINSLEFTRITVFTDTTITLTYEDYSAGTNFLAIVPVTLTIPGGPTPAWSKVRVRMNSYRVIMNFEMEYIEE